MKTINLPEPIVLDMNYTSFLDSLTDNGWQQIGRATYSRVFAHPKKPGRVLKVARDDPAYNTFLTYALANQDNPHFPRIFDVKCYTTKNEDDALTVVMMERLEPLKNAKAAHRWLWKMEAFAERAGYEILGYRAPVAWRSRYEMQAGAILQRLFLLERGDLHAGNVMLRGKFPVITDPVF